MKKHLLMIGAIAMSALVMSSCSDSDDPIVPDPDPEYVWLVDKITEDDSETAYAFAYNNDLTLKSITETSSSTVLRQFGYDNEGRLNKMTSVVSPDITYTYSNNTITETTAEQDGFAPNPTVIHLKSNGLFDYSLNVPSWNENMENKTVVTYDSKGRVKTAITQSYINNAMIEESGAREYVYDDKNPILHDGALPQWYYNTEQGNLLLGFPYLFPVNNITKYTAENMMGGTEVSTYKMEYNDDGYPTKWQFVFEDGVVARSYKISYKVVEK